MSNKYTMILIGNGLGMAVNSDHFPLEKGLQTAWSQLDDDTRNRIKNLFTSGDDLITEQQLEKHYEVIQACINLQRFENRGDLKWLDAQARDFPNKFQELIENTAWHFCDYEGEQNLLINFIKCLKYFIQHNPTHIATLNYDKLIYGNLLDTEIMAGYNGELVDGFLKSGFYPTNLNREFGKEFGWYLHLHGSPLFYTCSKTGLIKKTLLTDSLLERSNQGLRDHIVLCNTSLKTSQIAQSEVLLTYWHYFHIALEESNKIILFGCSGNDTHINKEISDWINRNNTNRTIKIIEYNHPRQNQAERQTFWSSELKLPNNYFSEKNLIRLPSILTYQFD